MYCYEINFIVTSKSRALMKQLIVIDQLWHLVRLLIMSATVRADIPSSFPFSRTYTIVARLKAVLYSFFFSKAALRRICVAVAVERTRVAFAGADLTPPSADIVKEEIGSLFDLLMVIDICAGGVTNPSFFVLLSSLRTIIYFALSSHSRREKSASFIASRTSRFGLLI